MKSRSLSTQSLASCELLFGILRVQLHVKRFRYKYSILFNFQGPAPFASRLTAYLFYHRTGSLSSTFLKRFSKFVSVSWPLRGALEYNTTTTPFCQPFFYKKCHTFPFFLLRAQKRPDTRSIQPFLPVYSIRRMGWRSEVYPSPAFY